jgi:hypothetical protein
MKETMVTHKLIFDLIGVCVPLLDSAFPQVRVAADRQQPETREKEVPRRDGIWNACAV